MKRDEERIVGRDAPAEYTSSTAADGHVCEQTEGSADSDGHVGQTMSRHTTEDRERVALERKTVCIKCQYKTNASENCETHREHGNWCKDHWRPQRVQRSAAPR